MENVYFTSGYSDQAAHYLVLGPARPYKCKGAFYNPEPNFKLPKSFLLTTVTCAQQWPTGVACCGGAGARPPLTLRVPPAPHLLLELLHVRFVVLVVKQVLGFCNKGRK